MTNPQTPEPTQPVMFGFEPQDWFSGANMGWTAEVCFVSAPTDAERGEIEAQLDALCARSGVQRDSKPSYWSGRWMLFLFGEESDHVPADGERGVFLALERALAKLHSVFVKSWHGPGVYELPNLTALLER